MIKEICFFHVFKGPPSSEVDGSGEYFRLCLHRPERRVVLRHPPVGDLLFRSELNHVCPTFYTHLLHESPAKTCSVSLTFRQEPLPEHCSGLQVLQDGEARLPDVPAGLCSSWDVSHILPQHLGCFFLFLNFNVTVTLLGNVTWLSLESYRKIKWLYAIMTCRFFGRFFS